MSVLESTQAAIKAAALTDMDDGAVAALLVLAEKIDTDDELREQWLSYGQSEDAPKWWKPLQVDNVSIPTYLKFCESLGLTPAGRAKLGEKKEATVGGKLASLQSIRRPA